MTDFAKLRELAIAALQDVDPGWRYIDGPLMGDIAVDTKPSRPDATFRLLRVGPGPLGPFIAAASPSTVIALLDRIAALEAAQTQPPFYREMWLALVAACQVANEPDLQKAALNKIERLNSLLTGRAARDANYAEADFEAVAENIAADPRWANRADSQRVARWALRQRRALTATQAALNEVTTARDELAGIAADYVTSRLNHADHLMATAESDGQLRSAERIRELTLPDEDLISQLRAAGRVK